MAKKTGFKISHPGPMETDITLNGKKVVSLDPEDGSQAIEAVEDVVFRVGKLLGIPVEEV